MTAAVESPFQSINHRCSCTYCSRCNTHRNLTGSRCVVPAVRVLPARLGRLRSRRPLALLSQYHRISSNLSLRLHPPTPPPLPSPDAPHRRSSQQPGLRAEGSPGWPTSLLQPCFRSLLPPTLLSASSPAEARRTISHRTSLHHVAVHLIPNARRLFSFYDTPSYAHDARHDGCCALRDPDRRRWQV